MFLKPLWKIAYIISISFVQIHAFPLLYRYNHIPSKISFSQKSIITTSKPKYGRTYPFHIYSTDNNSDSSKILSEETPTIPECYFRYHPNSSWRKRINIQDLKEGQILQGVVLKNNHLLQGKTGPKVFFECGVGRLDTHNKWQMVFGMCRLGTRRSKISAMRKRITRLTKQSQAPNVITLYVSKIRLDNQQLEVSLAPPTEEEDEDVDDDSHPKKRIPASSLLPQQELIGKVVDVRDYGVLIDVNANRNGLLHIQKVADLNGCYIDKKQGLEKAGLEKGTKLRVCVESNQYKRLALDFTPDVKQEAEEERRLSVLEKEKLVEEEERVKQDMKEEEKELEVEEEVEDSSPPEYDEAAWAEFAAADDFYYDGDDDNTDDGYDEDRDIEDSLGIGYY